MEALASGLVVEGMDGVPSVWTNTKVGGVEQQWRLTKGGYLENGYSSKSRE